MKKIVCWMLAIAGSAGFSFSLGAQALPAPEPELTSPAAKANLATTSTSTNNPHTFRCAKNLIAPVPHKNTFMRYFGKNGFARMANATDEGNFQTLLLKLLSAKLYIGKVWEAESNPNAWSTTYGGILDFNLKDEVDHPNSFVDIYQRELKTIDSVFHIIHPATTPPQAPRHGIDFAHLEQVAPEVLDPLMNDFWLWQELDDYSVKHRLSHGAILRAGYPALMIGLFAYRLLKTAALHSADYMQTALALVNAPKSSVPGKLSTEQNKIYADFFAKYPFYKDKQALVYTFPIMWRSLNTVSYDDLVGEIDLTGNYREAKLPSLISTGMQHLQLLAKSADAEDQQILQSYLQNCFRELHLDFEENLDFMHLIYHLLPDIVQDTFYQNWLVGRHPTLPLHQAFTPRQKRLPRLAFWPERLAISQLKRAAETEKDNSAAYQATAAQIFGQIEQKRKMAGMNWEDFIFSQEADIVYFAYDYYFKQIQHEIYAHPALGLTGKLIGRQQDLLKEKFDPRYLTPAEVNAVRNILAYGTRRVKDELFNAAYWPLANIVGHDREKVARMADPRLANFLLTYNLK